MNFEMYCSKSLLTKYLEEYMDELTRIQSAREKIDFSRIGYTLTPISDVVYDHMLKEGSDNDKAYEYSTSERILDKLNESIRNKVFTEEEMNHVFFYEWSNVEKSFLDIALRRYFLELYRAETIEELILKIDEEKNEIAKR